MNQYQGIPYVGIPGKLYREFSFISSGKDSRNLERIKNNFRAKWILIKNDHMEFYINIKQRPDLFEEVLIARNNSLIDKYPGASGKEYYLFRVL